MSLQLLRNNALKLLTAAGMALGLASVSQAQVIGRMRSVTVPEEPSVQLPSDRPTFMTSINYPLMYGAYAVWPYAAPLSFTNGGALPSHINDVSMRPTPVITRAYAPSLAAPATSAQITVNTPATAELWFEGMRIPNLGAVRRFASPALDPLKAYSYDIKATWIENGKIVSQAQRLIVRAGDRTSVTFPMAAAALGSPSLRPIAPERVIDPQISRLPQSTRLASDIR